MENTCHPNRLLNPKRTEQEATTVARQVRDMWLTGLDSPSVHSMYAQLPGKRWWPNCRLRRFLVFERVGVLRDRCRRDEDAN
jgi:hypothetical protein